MQISVSAMALKTIISIQSNPKNKSFSVESVSIDTAPIQICKYSAKSLDQAMKVTANILKQKIKQNPSSSLPLNKTKKFSLPIPKKKKKS